MTAQSDDAAIAYAALRPHPPKWHLVAFALVAAALAGWCAWLWVHDRARIACYEAGGAWANGSCTFVLQLEIVPRQSAAPTPPAPHGPLL